MPQREGVHAREERVEKKGLERVPLHRAVSDHVQGKETLVAHRHQRVVAPPDPTERRSVERPLASVRVAILDLAASGGEASLVEPNLRKGCHA